jgi:hypothetical protein
MLACGNSRVEPFQLGQDRIDVFTNPFRRGRGVARCPKLALVIDKGGGQDGAHALGVGAPGQVDAKGEDNGVLAFRCHGHSCSMSRGPVLVEARDLAGIVDQAAAWNRGPGA